MKKGFFSILAVLAVLAMVTVGCPTDGDDGDDGGQQQQQPTVTAVTLNSVAASPAAPATTTALTLTFDKAVPGLAASHITLSGVTGVTAGTLTGTGPVYTLGITGVTAAGTLTVTVANPTNVTVSGSPKTVAINFDASATPVTFTGVTAVAGTPTTSLTLTFSAAITGLAATDITLTAGDTGATKGALTGSGPTYTLAISGVTKAGAVGVAVAKTGYTISGSPQTVNVVAAGSGPQPPLPVEPFIDNAPTFTADPDNSDSTLNADGTITLAKNGTDKFTYEFPAAVYEADGTTLKYDFYRIDYLLFEEEAEWPSGNPWQATQVHIRTGDGTPFDTGGRYAGSNSYVPLVNQKSLVFETSYSNGGFMIEDIDTSSNSSGKKPTVQITSVSFYIAPKFNVTFDWNYQGAATVAPVTGIWGPFEGHPGYGVGAAWPVTPERADWYFLGWFDGLETATESAVTATTVITKNTDLKAKWTDVEPEKVEMFSVAGGNSSAVPTYKFKLGGETDTWTSKGVSKVTYTIWAPAGTVATRMHVVIMSSYSAAPAGNSNWGTDRLINVAGGSDAATILAKGKNAADEAGGFGEWVTYTWVVGPTVADVTTTANPGAEGVGGTTNYSTLANASTPYLALGLSTNGSTALNYYIKDVKLILADGTEIPNEPLDVDSSDPTKITSGAFSSTGTIVPERSWAPSPD